MLRAGCPCAGPHQWLQGKAEALRRHNGAGQVGTHPPSGTRYVEWDTRVHPPKGWILVVQGVGSSMADTRPFAHDFYFVGLRWANGHQLNGTDSVDMDAHSRHDCCLHG